MLLSLAWVMLYMKRRRRTCREIKVGVKPKRPIFCFYRSLTRGCDAASYQECENQQPERKTGPFPCLFKDPLIIAKVYEN